MIKPSTLSSNDYIPPWARLSPSTGPLGRSFVFGWFHRHPKGIIRASAQARSRLGENLWKLFRVIASHHLRVLTLQGSRDLRPSTAYRQQAVVVCILELGQPYCPTHEIKYKVSSEHSNLDNNYVVIYVRQYHAPQFIVMSVKVSVDDTVPSD